MILLFPQVEMFSELGWQQAADAVVRKKHVKVPQQPAFGFIWFVLCLQDLVWDDLLRMQRHMISMPSCMFMICIEHLSMLSYAFAVRTIPQ